MSEKKNFELYNGEMECKTLDVDKLEEVSGGSIETGGEIVTEKAGGTSNSVNRIFILDSKPLESDKDLSIKISD